MRRSRLDLAAVAVLLLAVCGHWLLFARYVRREVAWSYPVNFDQAHLLEVAYRTHELAGREGLGEALRYAQKSVAPTGSLLHLEAALLFWLRQPSRLTALAVNFLHLVLFQAALVAVLRARSRAFALSFLAVGLSWAAATTFGWAGGIDDFRIDFASWCLYGTFLALVIQSDLFRRRGWALAAGAVATLCVVTRTLTSVYLGALLSLWVAALAVRTLRARPDARADLRRQLSGAVVCAGCLVVTGIPALLARARNIWGYYVGGHVSGKLSGILADAAEMSGVWDNLLFYPQNLAQYHLGWTFLALAVFSVGALALARARGGPADAPAVGLGRAGELAFVLLAGLVPYAILTADTAKSPAVACIMVPVVLWVVVLAAARLAPRARSRALAVVAGLVFVGGAAFQVHRLSGGLNGAAPVEARRDVVRLHADLFRLMRTNGWRPIRVFVDRRRDYTFAFPVWTYEREGVLIPYRNALEHVIWAPSRDEVFRSLRESDVVLLTTPEAHSGWSYPYDRKLERLEPRLRRYSRRHLVEIGTYHLPDEVRLYARVARPDAAGEKLTAVVEREPARSTHP